MWSNDEVPGFDVEDCIRSADRLPRLPLALRNRVLDEALRVRHRTLSLHRIQTLTTTILAASLLLVLPGYYHSLQQPAEWPAPTTVTSAWPSATAPLLGVRTADAYEWGLVQAELADRSESARIIRGAL